MTTVGKLLVFLNLFAAVALLTWAGSLFVNRLDWVDRKLEDGTAVEGQLTQLKKEIADRLNRIKDAQGQYAAASATVAGVEARRQFRQERIDVFLEGARKGTFYTFPVLGEGPLLDLKGTPTKVVPGTTGAPLRGVKAIQDDLDREVSESRAFADAIAAKRTKFSELSRLINAEDVRITAQAEIAAHLRDEETVLESARVNWDEELRTLSRRQKQLERRLDTFGVKVGTVLSH